MAPWGNTFPVFSATFERWFPGFATKTAALLPRPLTSVLLTVDGPDHTATACVLDNVSRTSCYTTSCHLDTATLKRHVAAETGNNYENSGSARLLKKGKGVNC